MNRLLPLLLAGLALPALAEDGHDRFPPWELRAYWQNDSFLNPDGNQDRHYTNGLVFTFAYQPDWSDELFKAVGLEGRDTAAGVAFGQQIYTATNINLPNPPLNDWPYAGYLYGSFYLQRENPFLREDSDVDSLDHFQIDIGVVGPSSLAEEVQSEIHRTFGADDPQGWSTQLPDEFAIQFTYRKKWRIDLLDPGADRLNLQVIPQGAISAGLVERFIELGSVYRIGYNIPRDFGPGRLQDYASATAIEANLDRAFFAYAYGRTSVQFVEWNTFLDGSNFRNSRSVRSKPIVGQFEVGVYVGYAWENWSLGAGWSITFLTDQFEGQDTSDSFGQVTLALSAYF